MHNKKSFLLLLLLSLFDYTIPAQDEIATIDSEEQSPAVMEQNFDETIFNYSRIFAQVVDIANKKHYNISNPQESMIKAIDGFVNNLDAHSCLLDEKTYKDMLEITSGEFFGIGIVIDNMRKPKDKFLTMVDTIPDGPADRAGLLPMDKIIEIDNQLLEGMPTEKIITKIKGEKNTKVTIKVMRENHPEILTFEVMRDVIKEQHSLSFLIKNHNVAYISLSMFSDAATQQIGDLVKKAQESNLKGIILDLRNNSGGLLSAAINIGSIFLPKGSLIVTTKDKNNKETERYVTTRDPIAHNKIPIFILINNYSASASEILAGCLKYYSEQADNMPVFLVGTKTFGKGSVQEIIPVGGNCALKLTTSLYFLPDDTTLQGVGIEPDFLIERSVPITEQAQWFIKNYGREETLPHHIKTKSQLTKESETKKTPTVTEEKKDATSRRHQRAQEMLQTDNQLRDCITLINIFNSACVHTPELVKTRATAIAYLKDNLVCKDKLEIEEVTA